MTLTELSTISVVWSVFSTYSLSAVMVKTRSNRLHGVSVLSANSVKLPLETTVLN